jgi:hypothetical protein
MSSGAWMRSALEGRLLAYRRSARGPQGAIKVDLMPFGPESPLPFYNSICEGHADADDLEAKALLFHEFGLTDIDGNDTARE